MADYIGQQFGNYRLLQKLGRGNFAEVYLAEHLYLERLAAIKVLHVHIDEEMRERFLREARTVARLQHPHILPVLDFGFTGELPYLVMHYTPGGTLRSRYPSGTRLPIEQIVSYTLQTAAALDYAHAQRVIHRDVKPHNLLLTAEDEIMLGDFGLAVVQQSVGTASMSNPFAGTPYYMAPEQIQSHPTASSDQYALGVMVYEWLVGEVPFGGRTLIEVCSQHLTQPPPSLCKRLPDLPPAVEEVVFRALAKDPEWRFASVTEFALALERASDITERLVKPGTVKWQGSELSTLAQPPLALTPAEETDPARYATVPELPTMPHRVPAPVAVPTAAPASSSRRLRSSLIRNNRRRFLRRVRAIWIEGVLQHSLHGGAFIPVGLQEQLGVLQDPWHLVWQHPDVAPRPFLLGTRISQVYDAANEELLILGAPGSGKTTLLLELARDLLARAEQDKTQPMPVVFPLSSWATRQQPLAEWMVGELSEKYQVPRQLAQDWVEANAILPLLDGLDEVVPQKRTQCVETINRYRQEHPFLPLVVTSRNADYVQQAGRLQLTNAVAIQPLTEQQVNDYLAGGGEALWALRVALHQDASLRELAQTPLMLSILTVTYYGISVEELLRGGAAPTRQQVFERYVERMLKSPGSKARYRPEQTKHWLGRLARQLVSHGKTEFYLEQIQPDWLGGRWSRLAYRLLALVPIGAVLGVLLSWLVGASAVSNIGLLVYGQIGLLTGVLLSLRPGRAQPLRPWSWHSPITSGYLRNGWGLGLLLGLGIGCINELPQLKDIGSFAAGANALGCGLIGALVGLLCSVLIPGRTTEIRPTEFISWSWRNFFNVDHLMRGLALGLAMGLIRWLIYVPVVGLVLAPLYGLVYILLGLLLSTLLLGLLSGLSSEVLEERNRVRPNEGMRRSIRNSVAITLLVGPLFGVVSGASLVLINGLVYGSGLGVGVIDGLLYGLSGGLLTGLLFGGEAWIRHRVLRLLLWFTRSVPRNYPHFLDYAAERILLRKVGGGYIFIHRLLLDYFTSINV